MATEKLTLQQKFREFKGTIGIMKEAGAEFNRELIDVAYKKFAQRHLESITIEKPAREVNELEKSLYICLQSNIYSQEAVDMAFEVVLAARGNIPEGLLEKVCAHTGRNPQRFLEILDKLSVPELREVFTLETGIGVVRFLAHGNEFPKIMLNDAEMPHRAIKRMTREEVQALVKALSEHIGGELSSRRQVFSASYKDLLVAIKDYDHKVLDRYFPKEEKKRMHDRQGGEVPAQPKEGAAVEIPAVHAIPHTEERKMPASKEEKTKCSPPHEVMSFIKSSLGKEECDEFLRFAEQNKIALSDIGCASRAITEFKRRRREPQQQDTHSITLPRYNLTIPEELVCSLEREHKLTREEIELVTVFLTVGLRVFTKKSAVGGKYFRKELAMKNVRTFISGKEYTPEKSLALIKAFNEFDVADFLRRNDVLTEHKEKVRGECLSINTDKRQIRSASLYELIKLVGEYAMEFH